MNHFCVFNDNLRKFLLRKQVQWSFVTSFVSECHLQTIPSFLFLFSFPLCLFWSLPSSLLSSFPLPNSLLSLYACVTENLQFKWRCICLYLANFKPGFKNGRHAAEYVLCLQCHTLIPSNLFTDINANWENN